MFFLAYPGQGRETFNYVQLLGFLLLIFGTLVYNEILVIAICNFDRYTKDAMRATFTHEQELTDALLGNTTTDATITSQHGQSSSQNLRGGTQQ